MFKGFPQLGIVVINTTQSLSTLSAAAIDQGISSLQTNPNIQSIEPNRIVQISSQTIPTGVQRIAAEQSVTRSGHGNGTSRCSQTDTGEVISFLCFKIPSIIFSSKLKFKKE